MTAAAIRRNGAYAPLASNYADDDAIATLDIEENDRAEVLWTRGLAYCARDLSLNGFISDIALQAGKVLRRKPGKRGADTVMECAVRLDELGLWVREERGYRIRSWAKWNKTWAEVTRKRADDRDRKASGSDAEPPPDPESFPPDSARNPDGIHEASQRNGEGFPAPYTQPEDTTRRHDTSRHPPGAALAVTGEATAATIVAAYVDALHACGGVEDKRAKGRIAKDATELLKTNPPRLLIAAAQRLAANGYADLGAEARRLRAETTRPPDVRPSTTDAKVAQTLRLAEHFRQLDAG